MPSTSRTFGPSPRRRRLAAGVMLAGAVAAVVGATALSSGRPADKASVQARPSMGTPTAAIARVVRQIPAIQRRAFADLRRDRVRRDALPTAVLRAVSTHKLFGRNPALARLVKTKSNLPRRGPSLYLVPGAQHVCMLALPSDRRPNGRESIGSCLPERAAVRQGVFMVIFCVDKDHPDAMRVAGVMPDTVHQVQLLSGGGPVASLSSRLVHGYVLEVTAADHIRIGDRMLPLPESPSC